MESPIGALALLAACAIGNDAPEGRVTFNQQVAPILWKRCAGCHRPGEVGPFPLLTYRDASKRAEFLRDVVDSRRMPPWKAEPGFGSFRDERHLDDRERAVLAAWADSGAVEGEPADLPTPPVFPQGWQLGTPDLVLTMPEPYAIPAGGPDNTRVFVIPLPLDRDRSIAGIEYRPGNRRVVHHARVFFDSTAESRRRDAADPGPGFHCFGGADLRKPGLGEWMPGSTPHLLPRGVGRVVPSRSDLLLLVHYHPDGKPETDRSSVGLFFSKEPPTRFLAGIPLSSSKIDIPPGAKDYRVAVDATVPADCHAYGVIPHAHYLLRELKLVAHLPDGATRPMIWIKDWDFNWQEQYQYAEPVALPKGTRLVLDALYDNSADNPSNPNHPPRRVLWGLNSSDEMLSCHLQVIPDRPEDHRVFLRRWPDNLETSGQPRDAWSRLAPWAVAVVVLLGVAGRSWSRRRTRGGRVRFASTRDRDGP